MPVAVVVMGVSGSGKSTIGRRLAGRLGFDFEDADGYHPPANVAKMAAGIPLDDDDRWPWLAQLQSLIAERLAEDRSLVLACSALKRSYREVLAAPGSATAPVHFVYLRGDYDTLLERMRRRQRHYMKADMLASQYRDLEEPADAVVVDVGLNVGASLRQALAGLAARGVRATAERPGPAEAGGGPRTHAETPNDGDSNEEETA